MSVSPGDGGPLVSRHASKRRLSSAPILEPAIPPCPGVLFRPTFSGGRRALVDLRAFPRPRLALEAARLIWRGCHEGAYNSQGGVEATTQMLARLAEYLAAADPQGRVATLSDLREPDVDGFDVWLHDVRYEAGSTSPYERVQGLVVLLRRALDLGLAHPSIRERCRYASKYHDRASGQPRDAYDDFTMANLRAAARADVDRIVERMGKGRAMAARGGPPEDHSPERPEDVIWALRNRGMVSAEGFVFLELRHRDGRLTAPRLLDLVHLGIADCVPFLILLAEGTGLPIESVKELGADCLEDPGANDGFTQIRYAKRRRFNSDERFEDVVSTRERHSTGWLVRELLDATAPARRELGLGEREGPLLVGRVGVTLKAHTISQQAVDAWLSKHPVATDQHGGTLAKLQLSRIRKWHKASVEYVGGGGSLDAVRKDHSREVFVRHYGNIPFLRPRHDDANEAGIQEAHDAAMLPHVLTGAAEEALSRRPAEAARALASTEERVRGVASGEQDSWLAGCLDFDDSPYAKRGEPCGAPLYGCLDCANAVFTKTKIPNLLRLARHISEERQRMDLEAWRRDFGFAFARIHQILGLYPPADVEAARVEVAGYGRDFMLTQLTHRMRRT